jgi:hypothetical protein
MGDEMTEGGGVDLPSAKAGRAAAREAPRKDDARINLRLTSAEGVSSPGRAEGPSARGAKGEEEDLCVPRGARTGAAFLGTQLYDSFISR